MPTYTPPVATTDPFRRPYRVDGAGERITPPSKTDMLRQIIQAHPATGANRWRSLDHYNSERHAGVRIRARQDAYDAVAPRWK